MPADDERREVARRLRDRLKTDGIGGFTSGEFGNAVYFSVMHGHRGGYVEAGSFLADLIEPSCDPTERGIDSIYDWCFAAIEGADGSEDELFCAIMSAIEDYRHPERVTATTVRPVDRDALLALAGDVDGAADDSGGFEPLAGMLRDIARRIREACGERLD